MRCEMDTGRNWVSRLKDSQISGASRALTPPRAAHTSGVTFRNSMPSE